MIKMFEKKEKVFKCVLVYIKALIHEEVQWSFCSLIDMPPLLCGQMSRVELEMCREKGSQNEATVACH